MGNRFQIRKLLAHAQAPGRQKNPMHASVSFNKTQRTEKRDSVGVVMVVFGYYLQQLVITCNNILCNILLQYFILPFEKCDEFVKLRSVGFSQQLAKKPLASWGETTTNSCRCINTAFPFFVRTVHQRENQVIHQTYLL